MLSPEFLHLLGFELHGAARRASRVQRAGGHAAHADREGA